MSKFLKENWFVALIAVLLICMTAYFAYDQNKDKLPGKKDGGKQVVYSVDDTNVTADQLYDKLYKSYGENDLFLNFQRTLLDEKVKTTDELKTQVQNQVDQAVAYYQQNYGYGQEYLDSMIRYYYGYPSYYDYVMYSMKSDKLYGEYIGSHLEELYTPELQSELNGRIISYVVLTVANADSPTEEEAAKLKEAQDAWSSGQYSAENFADFATAYSQDSGASNGGKLGYLDAKTENIDETFKQAALQLKEGEVSDWVQSDDFGYFLIKCDSVNPADFVEESPFISNILSSDDKLGARILWESAEELGVSFADDDVRKAIRTNLGFED
ncbi:MAG: peptidylprolyl isomerase [Erysipelotrichaceae bacterium]|nr:peptidylprolyl isomerase [Erysipelotrichaceae bacterium]